MPVSHCPRGEGFRAFGGWLTTLVFQHSLFRSQGSSPCLYYTHQPIEIFPIYRHNNTHTHNDDCVLLLSCHSFTYQFIDFLICSLICSSNHTFTYLFCSSALTGFTHNHDSALAEKALESHLHSVPTPLPFQHPSNLAAHFLLCPLCCL